jgi:hypothetical protein
LQLKILRIRVSRLKQGSKQEVKERIKSRNSRHTKRRPLASYARSFRSKNQPFPMVIEASERGM